MLAYNDKHNASQLTNCWISQASANQRAGRTGRMRPGTVYRLYSSSLYNKLAQHELSEVQRYVHSIYIYVCVCMCLCRCIYMFVCMYYYFSSFRNLSINLFIFLSSSLLCCSSFITFFLLCPHYFDSFLSLYILNPVSTPCILYLTMVEIIKINKNKILNLHILYLFFINFRLPLSEIILRLRVMLEDDVSKNPIKSDILPTTLLDTVSKEKISLLQDSSDELNIMDPRPDSKEDKLLDSHGNINKKKNNSSEVTLKNTEKTNPEEITSVFFISVFLRVTSDESFFFLSIFP